MVLFLLFLLNIVNSSVPEKQLNENKNKIPPNIIFILADDLGWNDVGFHGSNEIPTPNIDALSYNSIILNSHYGETLCTPSRASLLTGKYPIHLGMQHGNILEPEPRGLPLSEKIFPQYLEKFDYQSHAVGKWHLGFYKKDYTPIYRGFKSHYGFWNGYQDYYNHTVQASFSPFEGYDMRRGDAIDWSGIGNYSTDLFTNEAVSIIKNHNRSKPLFLYLAHLAPHSGTYEDPLQAPTYVTEKLKHIVDVERRKYAGMVVKLDESVGKIVTALREVKMLNNSIIVFVSDNGAATKGLHYNRGSNWPLKGEKMTPWEGGIRTAAFIWSPLVIGSRVSDSLMHISDWLPTLYTAAGGDYKDLGNIDGVSQWEYFIDNEILARNEVLHNIDEIFGYEAIRIGDHKFVSGTVFLGYLDKWSGKTSKNVRKSYNVTEILNCEVSYNLMQIGYLLPTFEKIISLRKLSTVICSGKKYVPCLPFQAPCLFNIKRDPCEIRNIYNLTNRSIIEVFRDRLNFYRKNALSPSNVLPDTNADPKFYNNTWVSWYDQLSNKG